MKTLLTPLTLLYVGGLALASVTGHPPSESAREMQVAGHPPSESARGMQAEREWPGSTSKEASVEDFLQWRRQQRQNRQNPELAWWLRCPGQEGRPHSLGPLFPPVRSGPDFACPPTEGRGHGPARSKPPWLIFDT